MALVLMVLVAGVELLARADRAFAEGLREREQGRRGAKAFREAAAALEELRESGRDNPTVLHNLGNAYWLAGDLPRAILTYRRGLRQYPADAELQEALRQARERVVFADGSTLGHPVEEVRSRWRAVPVGWLFVAAGGVYALACLALTRWWMLRRGGLMTAGLVLLALAVTLGIAVLDRELGASPRELVVVARDGVSLRKGDGEAFPAWFPTPLNRGVEAEVLFRRGGWLQVELPGGEVGWVAGADVVE